ncbi:MAG: hypothetical protein MUC55_02810 [Burkholderiales bacterium]|jgi:hypothetical protein|nr:hypothetical protein [Burkholderiales bacterium]
MFKRNLVLAIAAVSSLAAAQSALAVQPAGFGYDPYHVFGASRTVAPEAYAAQPAWNPFGFDPYNVPGYGSDIKESKKSPMSTAERPVDAFGYQAGA